MEEILIPVIIIVFSIVKSITEQQKKKQESSDSPAQARKEQESAESERIREHLEGDDPEIKKSSEPLTAQGILDSFKKAAGDVSTQVSDALSEQYATQDSHPDHIDLSGDTPVPDANNRTTASLDQSAESYSSFAQTTQRTTLRRKAPKNVRARQRGFSAHRYHLRGRQLRRAVIYSEILGRPVSLRKGDERGY
ncbi:MAG: hypothetical protein ACQEQV_10320 [Fibrobacterota bacterium]